MNIPFSTESYRRAIIYWEFYIFAFNKNLPEKERYLEMYLFWRERAIQLEIK